MNNITLSGMVYACVYLIHQKSGTIPPPVLWFGWSPCIIGCVGQFVQCVSAKLDL